MRHHNANRKFGRTRNQRKALISSLALSLIKRGKIKTTLAKAKELRPFVEKLVTKGGAKTLSSKRILISRLQNQKPEADKVIKELSPKYADRKGGYTRIMKLPKRAGDASPMAIIEFV